ncbi:VOC family protein [Nocardiopsis lambiniae]|uniref:VOC family protein n=1 Tax=Nocardiopsis lambiniae TaxID=3075539 RepID=A0ABU2M8P8_9ACTN|nr:VOC family protein [Nocardiopsis sp. DSM 44743]MDT0328341.1 VOC family protein [Nocardiopsis sp. DSM 44743]
MGFPAALDHLVYAVPDLAEGTTGFEELTGVRPVPGGRHPVGSANTLVALTRDGARAPRYLEVIGPDPERADPGPVRVFGLSSLDRPHLATFAVGVTDLPGAVKRARAAGHDPGDAEPWSRATPDGGRLRWSLAKKESGQYPDPVPFLIDWGATPQPGLGDLPTLELVSVRAEHPDPEEAGRSLSALGVELDLVEGPEPLLEAVLHGPKGEVVLR